MKKTELDKEICETYSKLMRLHEEWVSKKYSKRIDPTGRHHIAPHFFNIEDVNVITICDGEDGVEVAGTETCINLHTDSGLTFRFDIDDDLIQNFIDQLANAKMVLEDCQQSH